MVDSLAPLTSDIRATKQLTDIHAYTTRADEHVLEIYNRNAKEAFEGEAEAH